MTEPLVVADRVARTFGRGANATVALHDASCAVHAGQRLVLVGPSGSGKSTLLHILAGLDEPTAGTVLWPALGAHPRELRPGSVSVVFQGPSLLPALDAAENVAFPLLLAGVADDEAAAAAATALARLGLTDIARQLPEELSGGQAQRVAVARALVTGPRLLLADEPTGQLDHAAAAAVIDALEAVAVLSGAAVVVTTHDAIVAARFPDRWAMRDGRLSLHEGAWAS